VVNIKKPLFWLSCSLVIPLYFGIISTYYAFSQNYIVQDDVRQHVVWLQRFIDPQLFPNDLIADYFINLAPVGYKFFYWTMAKLGIEPVILAKILPLFLALIATVYIYKLSLKIFPIPASAFLTCWLFNQLIWLNDDLISATPRAFVYPFFAAFLYYLIERSLIPLLISIALQGLFYPQLLLVEIAILTIRLFCGQGIIPKFSQNKENFLFWIVGLGIALLILLPVTINKTEFFTLVTPEQMRVMPEFGWRGRNQYFGVNSLQFIFLGNSGIQIPLFPSIVWVGFALPFLSKSRFPILNLITAEVKILWQIILASLGMFFLAHLLLPKLHLPSRYTLHSFRFVIAIAAEIVLLVLLESGWRWWQNKQDTKSKFTKRESLCLGLIGIGATIVVIFPIVPPVFLGIFQTWIVGTEPTIYQFLAEQPKDTLIASLASEADNLPAFSGRSNLVGREFALAYHPAYYEQMKQRAIALIDAQYNPDLSVNQKVIDKYKIDFFLIERNAFEPDYLLQQEWLIRSSFREKVFEANEGLKQGEIPALKKLGDRCSVVSTTKSILVDANCLKSIAIAKTQ
jgi:hypothetical protein